MSVSAEKLYMTPEESQRFDEERNNNNKDRRNFFVATGLAIAISATMLAGGLFNTQARYTNNANSLINDYRNIYVQQDYCNIQGKITTDSKDTKLCKGEDLVKALENHDIKYCSILDEYYTPNGTNIAKLSVKSTQVITCSAIATHSSDGKTVYSAPSGYVYNGDGTCSKFVNNIFTVLSPVSKDGLYDLPPVLKNDESISYEVYDIEIIESKPYSEILDYNIVEDVADEPIYIDGVASNKYESEIILQKRK